MPRRQSVAGRTPNCPAVHEAHKVIGLIGDEDTRRPLGEDSHQSIEGDRGLTRFVWNANWEVAVGECGEGFFEGLV
jgi:hypothetical protein